LASRFSLGAAPATLAFGSGRLAINQRRYFREQVRAVRPLRRLVVAVHGRLLAVVLGMAVFTAAHEMYIGWRLSVAQKEMEKAFNDNKPPAGVKE